MVKRTIEIDDSLDERVELCKEEILDDFIEYFLENPDMDDFEEYYQAQGCDYVHECCDSNTPIYYSDIDGLWYLYSDFFEDAYKDVFGNELHDSQNYKQVAIYCYLSNAGFEFLNEMQSLVDDWIDDEHITMKEIETELKELI